jgi:hypothetical protein
VFFYFDRRFTLQALENYLLREVFGLKDIEVGAHFRCSKIRTALHGFYRVSILLLE